MSRVTSPWSFAVVFLAACVPSTVDTQPDRPVASASPSAAPARPDAAAAIAAPRPAETPAETRSESWRSVPKERGGFWAVLDGICSELEVRRVGSDALVWYGGNEQLYTSYRQGPASFAALESDALVPLTHPEITSPTSVSGTSLENFVIADSTGNRSAVGGTVHRYTRGTWSKFSSEQVDARPWLDEGVIGTLAMARANGDIWVEGSKVKPPAAINANLLFPAMAAFPSGDVLAVGRTGQARNGPLVARHWSPTKPLSQHVIDKALPSRFANVVLLEHAPDEVYLALETRLARWDGTQVRALGAAKGAAEIRQIYRAGPDDLWIVTTEDHATASSLQHVTAAGTTVVRIPEPLVSLDGPEHGVMWAVGASGKLYRRDDEAWTTVKLPPGPFSQSGVTPKAKHVVVKAKDDVLVIAKYWEKAESWKEQELHTMLFRTKRVKETLRCNEPDPENNNVSVGRGFGPWPPLADASCETPFVVLARRSKKAKVVDDWPKLRAALSGRADLGPVTLVELVSGDRTFVGAKAPSFEVAKRMAALATKADRLRPEIVCAEPTPTRTIGPDAGAATK